ncbi:PIN domain-containing protein [Mucilaginibacter celer]|uniref:PIN domain-containing protein n=1 Tax=Mucilaginibacter celer TaxID=2305508 RepID=UPI0013CEBA4D
MATNKVICDTDVLIDYWNTNEVRHVATKQIIDNIIGRNNVWISAITQMELLVGAFNKAELVKINKNISTFTVIGIGDEIVSNAVQLIKHYSLSPRFSLAGCYYCSNFYRIRFEAFYLQCKGL